MKKIASFWIIFLLTILSAEAAKGERKFYLTQDAFTGAQALNACADGYHMASLWEILDVSNLKYDTTLGLIRDDSGSGPVSGFGGWIRTGVSSDSINPLPGIANCNAWTTDSNSALGTNAELISIWNTPVTHITTPWVASVTAYSFQFPVWCVQD